MGEFKIPAFPILEPLSKATETTLKPIKFLETDFLEIDVDDKGEHFITQSVCLKRCPSNILPSIDDAASPEYVQTPDGAFYKDDAYYHYPSWNATSAWYNRIPERKQLGYGKWRLAGTDYTALIIHHIWPHYKLIFKSEMASALYTYLLRRFFVQSKGATLTAEWKLTNKCPVMPKEFIEHKKLPLTDYQKVALLVSMMTNAYALFMEQGTGKTPIVVNRSCLEGTKKRIKKEGMHRALIICPQQVRLNWEREYVRFATVPGKTCVLRGSKLNKVRSLVDIVADEKDCAWSAAILSIDSVGSIWENLKLIKWDLVVIDESHKIKNSKTNRFKNVMKIDDLRAKSKMVLTGTPITNTVFDLWSQWEWLAKGFSGFSTYENFRSFHGRWETVLEGGSAVQKLAGFKNVPLIQERLARSSFLLRKVDAGLNLPDKVYDIYEVAMNKAQAKIYEQTATKLAVEIDEILASSEDMNLTVEHILTKLIRLAQICSGHVKLDDDIDNKGDAVKGRVIQISDKNPKIEALVNLIKEDWENDINSKCIVWACFIEDLRAISEKLDKEGLNHVGYHSAIKDGYRVKDSAAAEDVINFDDSCRILLANPASAGVGQNYLGYDVNNPDKSNMYVNHHIYFSCNWSAVDRIQSEDRSHRRGTRTNLRITDLVVPYTIDQEIRDRVTLKREMAMTIQDIRDILNNVLRGYRR
jgi:hypothetical protein